LSSPGRRQKGGTYLLTIGNYPGSLMRMGHLIFLTQTGQNKRNGETYYDQREGKCAGNKKKKRAA
ncbi:hypothetical protein, partial [Cronobacter malonaticus]|uniref:hypothetical protein n=1 Tax=Cronobacter malonaticus TaxID=413503 RepID=UPI001F161BF0